MNPLDYGLCDRTVTLYRRDGIRQVAENCYFDVRVSTPTKEFGKSMEKKILLIIPGTAVPLQPGDRVFAGIGPERVDWETFLPVSIPELYELQWAAPCYWAGQIAHWEGGA